MSNCETLEALEIRLLLQGIYEHYGYDFRDYAPATLQRRIWERTQKEKLASVSGLLACLLHDPDCMDRLAGDLSISVSAMFRDPTLFDTFRNQVVPLLRTYPFIRIWHAGCGRGEEVYSMAVLLAEEGLYERCRIYATDMNEAVLHQAQSGVFPLKQMQKYTRNYQDAGGKASFSEYYTANYDRAIFRSWLKKNLVFSRHNLATDSSFNEFNVILCRNVMIYFNRALQEKAHRLFFESLSMFGFLVLGRAESFRSSPYESCYEVVNQNEKIYKKVADL